jgi:hypothetical protein
MEFGVESGKKTTTPTGLNMKEIHSIELFPGSGSIIIAIHRLHRWIFIFNHFAVSNNAFLLLMSPDILGNSKDNVHDSQNLFWLQNRKNDF